MTTYTDTQAETPDPWSQPPDRYSLFLACRSAAHYVEVSPDSAGPKFEVMGIPAAVTPAAVAMKLQSIAIFQHPDQLLWSAVADLPRGTLLHVTKEPVADGATQLVARVADPTHWTGHRCIGWFKP